MTFIRSRALRVAVAAASLSLVAGACGGDSSSGGDESAPTTGAPADDATTTAPPGGTATAQAGTVSVKGFAFNPAATTVKVGDTVTWSFDDGSTAHTVTADDASFSTAPKATGTFEHTFAAAGTFAYHCEIHSSMKGTITVS